MNCPNLAACPNIPDFTLVSRLSPFYPHPTSNVYTGVGITAKSTVRSCENNFQVFYWTTFDKIISVSSNIILTLVAESAFVSLENLVERVRG